jgi:hypothetical protein
MIPCSKAVGRKHVAWPTKVTINNLSFKSGVFLKETIPDNRNKYVFAEQTFHDI